MVCKLQGLLLWLTNSNGFKVESLLSDHGFIKINRESFGIQSYGLVFLLDAVSFDVLDFKLKGF